MLDKESWKKSNFQSKLLIYKKKERGKKEKKKKRCKLKNEKGKNFHNFFSVT